MLLLTNLNMSQNEIQNAIIQPLAAAPANPRLGQIYYSSVDLCLYQYNGTNWATVGTVSVDSVNGKTGVVILTQDDVGDGTTFVRTHNDLTNELVQTIQNTATFAAAIQGKIPAAASTTNQLADKEFVTDAITQQTAIFRGSYATKASLDAVQWQTTDPTDTATYVSNNDYAVVQADETHNNECWRYIYVTGTGWTAQYRINESPLTSAQINALNSGITAALVAVIGDNQTAISSITNGTSINDFAAAETAIIAAGSKTATGTIGTSNTSASVQYTGTLLGYYATMGGSEVLVDTAVGANSVTFSVAAAPSSSITCTVVYR